MLLLAKHVGNKQNLERKPRSCQTGKGQSAVQSSSLNYSNLQGVKDTYVLLSFTPPGAANLGLFFHVSPGSWSHLLCPSR